MRIGTAFSIIILVQFSSGDLQPPKPAESSDKSGRRLAPCQSCRTLVNSFILGMEKTAKGHYGGGDTAWEEENGKIYKDSELRLIEIQEKLCAELSVGKNQCHELALENEDKLEEWWHNYRNAGHDLFTWLCISRNVVCCPDLHYGSNCTPCAGYPNNICSGHGKCKGAGSRKGNGDCSCDIGYSGQFCTNCAKDFFVAYNEGDKLICSACHKACKQGCTGAGIKQCTGCKDGWESDDDLGCLDINECLAMDSQACKFNEFCVNTEGSYSCIGCDKACDGCYGDGPDMCEKCAQNYVLKNNICVDSSTTEKSVHMNLTRYFTYLGLCIATCIIFQKNVAAAAGVGIAVAIYITVSEYLLSTMSGL